jgi:hypothetical protein
LQSGTHHAANVEIGRVRLFIGRHTFYTSELNIELSGPPLKPGVDRIAIYKGFPRHSPIAATVERPLFLLGSFFEVMLDTTEHYDGLGAIAPCFNGVEQLNPNHYRRRSKLMIRVEGRALKAQLNDQVR